MICMQEEVDESRPLGLKLSKTPSFQNMIYMITRKQEQEQEQEQRDWRRHRLPKSMDEKLKAANFFMMSLVIGSWERSSVRDVDMIAKIYYAKKKIVWEVLDGYLKNKIEIDWSNITAIRAIFEPHQPGILDVEVGKPPSFFQEIPPERKKHTKWKRTSDFTGGQAPICRRHRAIFRPGVLDTHYEKLLQSDESLFKRSQKPFPSYESPNFYIGPARDFNVPLIPTTTTARESPVYTLTPNIPTIADCIYGQFVTQSPATTVWDHGPINLLDNCDHGLSPNFIADRGPINLLDNCDHWQSSDFAAYHTSSNTNNVATLPSIGNTMVWEDNNFQFSDGALAAQGRPSTSSLSYSNGNNMNANQSQIGYQITDQWMLNPIDNMHNLNHFRTQPTTWLPSQEPNTNIVTGLQDNLTLPYVPLPPQGSNKNIVMGLQDNLIPEFVQPIGNNLASHDIYPTMYLDLDDWK